MDKNEVDQDERQGDVKSNWHFNSPHFFCKEMKAMMILQLLCIVFSFGHICERKVFPFCSCYFTPAESSAAPEHSVFVPGYRRSTLTATGNLGTPYIIT